MAHDVFISHSSRDRAVANAVCAVLENGRIRCWVAPRDVQPGRSYSGECTRAIQTTRVFVLLFSKHSNASEQVLREVQLAANSHLHIVQFRLDTEAPSDDLTYYLSGPHWLDAVTPPLEEHLKQLQTSIAALLALPSASGSSAEPHPPAPSTTQPHTPPLATNTVAPLPPSAAAPSRKGLIAAAALLLLAGLGFAGWSLRHKPKDAGPSVPQNTAATALVTPAAPANALGSVPNESTTSFPAANSDSAIQEKEAQNFVAAFYRDMQGHSGVDKLAAYFDDTVDYYNYGRLPKASVAEQLRQYLASYPTCAFDAIDIKLVQPTASSNLASVTFNVRYLLRGPQPPPSSGHSLATWDLVRRGSALKIARFTSISYPDPAGH